MRSSTSILRPSESNISSNETDIVKACELVGRFFYHWSQLEFTINRAIWKLFDVAALEGLIITSNLQLRDRLHIVNTALQFKGRSQDEVWKRRVRKTINRIGRLGGNRNFLAHTMFSATTTGHVDFFHVEARGSLNLPDTLWHPKQFQCQYDLIQKADVDLEQLTKSLEMHQQLIRLLAQQPTLGTAPPSYAGLLTPFLQAQPNYPAESATPETNLQTDPKPQPKGEADNH